MKTHLIFFNLWAIILLSLMVSAQVSEKLASAIHIYESGRMEHPFTISTYNECDINGIINITFDREAIRQVMGDSPAPSFQQEAAAREYAEKARQLNHLLAALERFSSISPRWMQAQTAQNSLLQAAAAAGTTFYEAFERYLASVPESLALEIEDGYDDALEESRAKANLFINTFIKAEIHKTNQLIAQLSINAVRRPHYEFQLSGKLVPTKGDERWLDIPGYFSAAIDRPSPFKKVRFQFTAAEKAVINAQEEMIQHLANISRSPESVRQQFREILANFLQNILNIEAQAEAALADIPKSLPEIGTSLLASFRDSLTSLSAVSSTYTQLTDLKVAYENLGGSMRQVKSKMRGHLLALQEENPAQASTAMFRVLDALSDFSQDVANFNTQLSTFRSALAAFTETASRLSSTDLRQAATAAQETLQNAPEMQQLFLNLGAIANRIATLTATLPEKVQNVFALFLKTNSGNQLSTPLLPLFSTKGLDPGLLHRFDIRGEDELMDSSIPLQFYQNRKKGDAIILYLSVKKNDAEVLKQKILITIDSFSWNSSLHSGLVFIRPEKEKHNAYPTAAVSWMLKYRGRAEAPARNFWHSFGIGFHTSTLVVSEEKTHIGIGPAIHMANNLLQFGYGWDLVSVEHDAYFYIGIGIMDLLQFGQ